MVYNIKKTKKNYKKYMNNRFPLLKVVLAFMLSFVGQLSFADGILVFQVTDTRNKPLEGVKIKLSGDSTIADLEFKTDELGRYTNPKFKTGTYDYEVVFGDWAKGSITVPEENFGWANINFRELIISFKDDNGVATAGRTVKLYVDNKGEKGEFIKTKISDSTGLVKYVIPEGKYIYETIRNVQKVTVDDKVKTQEVSIPSGDITHKTFFEFRKNNQPYKVSSKEFIVNRVLENGKDTIYGEVTAPLEEYSRTKGKINTKAGDYHYIVETSQFGKIDGFFSVDDNCSIDSLIIPINIDSLTSVGGGSGNGGNGDSTHVDPFEKQLAIWDTVPGIGTTVTINVFDPADPSKPLDNVFCYMDMLSVGKPMPYAVTNINGRCDLLAKPNEAYTLHVANRKIGIENLQNDTVINVYLKREEYTDVLFKIAFEGDEFLPTTIQKVNFETRYETDSFYMPANLVLIPTKSETSDTLYYVNPLRVGAGKFDFDFTINEMKSKGSKSSDLWIREGDTLRYAYYNLVPTYKVNIILCKLDTVSRYFNAFPISINGETKFTNTNGEYTYLTTRDSLEINAVKKEMNFLVTNDTTVYFPFERLVQNVYFKFVHDGQVVYPTIQYLEVFNSDSSEVRESQGILISKTGNIGDKTFNMFPDSMNLENGTYDLVYTMKDFYYNGTFNWGFDIENARGTDTTIYVVIPTKRNVELIITDALGEYVENVYGNIQKWDESGEHLINSFEFDASKHERLLSNQNGVVLDHLLPGKYQLKILDIVKNFVVGDYDLKFDIRDGVPVRHVKFIVKNKETQKPMQGLELIVNQNDAQYATDYTSEVGEIVVECVNGEYSYILNYGKNHNGTFTVNKDTTIYIYVENEVKVENLTLDAKDCVAAGGSVKIDPIFSPNNVTRNGLKWTMDNPVLGYIDGTGKFTANTIGLTGIVTIKATTVDGTSITAEKMIQIGGTSCGDSIKTEFEGGVDEIARTEDSLKVIITPGKEVFERCYAVQELQGEKWVVIAGPTHDTAIVISTVNMTEKEHLVRVISGTDCDKVANGNVTSGDPESADQIGDTLKIKNTSIFFKTIANGICEKMDSMLIEIDGENLDTLIAGTSIKWYSKTNNDTDFVEITKAKDKKSVKLDLVGETTIKVALATESTELVKTQKVIASEDSIKIKISADKDKACYGDAVSLNADVIKGTYASITWEDNSQASNRNVNADTITYKVVAESKLGYCPNATDSINLVIDFNPEVELAISRDAVCDDSSNVKLTITSEKERTDLIYTWKDFETKDSVLTDAPTENTTYEATVNTTLGICNSVTLKKTVSVANNVEFEASTSDSIYCKGNEVAIGIKKINGGSLNENIQFTLNDKLFSGDTAKTEANTTVYALRAKDLTGGCPDAVDTIRIKIDQPVDFNMTQTATTICNVGSDSVIIKVNADETSKYDYTWSTGATDTMMISVLPDTDSTYVVMASSQYGRCPSKEDSVSIVVNEAMKVSIEADVDRICQTGVDSVKLTAIAENGKPTSWTWWDGTETIKPERTVLPTATSELWVKGNDFVCATSDKASVTITVDEPHTAHLATTSTKFVYGGSIDMVASFDGKVEGPITWYSEDTEGEVSSLDETEELKYTDMPSGDTKYYFVAKNGSCPDIKSDVMTIALVDDIDIPTVFTPYEKNGENDEFMLGYEVVIYDRFGNLIHRGDNGWDGTYKGDVADAGVYVYTLTLKDGREKKGTIQVFKRD